MYIYFDSNGTIKEIVNDVAIRKGSADYNKLYVYIEGNPEIDDIWYFQKFPNGNTSNEVSFINDVITKAIPYDAKRDLTYFKDFVQYKFYVFTLTSEYLNISGLAIGTIRIAVDNSLFALGELTFNIQANEVNADNGITQSQYDYLLLAYASRTLSEQTGSDLDTLLDDKIEAKATDIIEPIFEDYKSTIDEEVEAQNETIDNLLGGTPQVFDTASNITALTENKGVAVATDTGQIWYWNGSAYVNSGIEYQATVIADDSVHKNNLNNDIYQSDVISMGGVTFVSPTNSVAMIIYFQATGTLTIGVKGTIEVGGTITYLKIGSHSTNTATSPTLSSNEAITGTFEKTYTITHSRTYTCVVLEVAVSSYTTFDEVLRVINPEITINGTLMTSYSNIVFNKYTPSNYEYMITGKPSVINNQNINGYLTLFYNSNTAPYLVKHNTINVTTAQELVNAINSIATSVSDNLASATNVYDIYLASGEYELYDVIDKTNLQDQVLFSRGLEIPDYVNLYGVGDVTISLTLPSTESATNVQILSTLNTYGENHFENLNIEITNGRYCVHDDDGGPYKNRTISFKNCTFKHNGNTIGSWNGQDCYGAGYTGGRKGIFTNCKMESVNQIALYMHTSSAWYMTDKCYLELNNCILLGNYSYNLDIHDPYGASNTAIVSVNNCYLENGTIIRGTQPFVVYGGGNNDFSINNSTTTPSKIYVVGNSNSSF